MLKRAALIIAVFPGVAGAVEGTSVLRRDGMPATISAKSGFPHYDIGKQCGDAWKPSESGLKTCILDQTRLATLTAQLWDNLVRSDKEGCMHRADLASASPYSVLYACSKGAIFRAKHQTTTATIPLSPPLQASNDTKTATNAPAEVKQR